MFSSVLVANRGEIAVRIIRTLRDLGIRSIAVYSDADAGARHVREANVAVRLGPGPARDSYLNIDAVLEAVRVSGAQAVHPGYGFLAENAAFAHACAAAGVTFIGPPPAAVQTMGDKIAARRAVAEVGVPVVPGRSTPGMTDAALADAAGQVGYPVLLKPSAGGGGKGMRVVRGPAELAEAIASARREAAAGFGDDTLFVERLLARPRHVEVQVLADAYGTVLHLGERECSLQRRYQKIIEEAPSPLLDPRTRERLGAAAVATAGAVGYVGAGTVEFILSADSPDEFYFMEMNTRLQVEHPVTELVTGVDLVAEQIRIAAGEPLRFGQADVRLTGHAIEARVYAEDPDRDFLPTGGQVLVLREPSGPAVRVDAGVGVGDTVGGLYDPMLAKVIAWGPDRAGALIRLDTALADTVLLGVTTNIGFLRALLAHPDVVAGRLDTGLVERDLAELTAREPTGEELVGYALARLLALQPTGPLVDVWDIPSGWRPGEPAWLTWDVVLPGAVGAGAGRDRASGPGATAAGDAGSRGPGPAAGRPPGDRLTDTGVAAGTGDAAGAGVAGAAGPGSGGPGPGGAGRNGVGPDGPSALVPGPGTLSLGGPAPGVLGSGASGSGAFGSGASGPGAVGSAAAGVSGVGATAAVGSPPGGLLPGISGPAGAPTPEGGVPAASSPAASSPGGSLPGEEAPGGASRAAGLPAGEGPAGAGEGPAAGLRAVSTVRVAARGTPEAARVRVADGPPIAALISQFGDELLVTVGAVTTRWVFAWQPSDGTGAGAAGAGAWGAGAGASTGEVLWLGRDGRSWALAEAVPTDGTDGGSVLGGQARSPMPGTVIAVLVEPGMTVAVGQSLVVVEAMKMEHTVSAAGPGVVTEVLVRPGDLVGLDQLLAVVATVDAVDPSLPEP